MQRFWILGFIFIDEQVQRLKYSKDAGYGKRPWNFPAETGRKTEEKTTGDCHPLITTKIEGDRAT